MNIKVNGEVKDINSTTIAGLFKELDIQPLGMVVHVNAAIVHWTKYDAFQIEENADIEIIRVIAGG